MANDNVWFVTGAGRGLGLDIVRAALAAGYRVVATGRRPEALADAIGAGTSDDLLVLKLDVTRSEDAMSAVAYATDRFGRIDVLVNNAGSVFAGAFEELPAEDFRAQIEVNLFGPLNVTRAVLPVMRKQRRGLVVTVSSTAGITGGAFVSAYAAAKFGLEGWMESLAAEVEPFGIRAMLVVPGSFRTELLTDDSMQWPRPSIEEYAEATQQRIAVFREANGVQVGDSAKTRQGPDPTCGHASAAPALAGWCRRRRDLREEGRRIARPGERPPCAVLDARA